MVRELNSAGGGIEGMVYVRSGNYVDGGRERVCVEGGGWELEKPARGGGERQAKQERWLKAVVI